MNAQSAVVRALPLGGVGEMGKNMMAFECGDDIIVVDAGLKFPDDTQLGIDYVIPDISWLLENKDRVRALCLTHGHEDHIGAVPYVAPELDCPIYGTALTLGLVRSKLKEHGLDSRLSLNTVAPRERVTCGAMTVEWIRVAHSIPDACALAIDTPVGRVLHTGDFKFDLDPIDGEKVDTDRLQELAGAEGFLALFSDSTNAERPGHTGSESEIRPAFDDIFGAAEGRVIIAAFASNLHRVQQAIDAADAAGRKIYFTGRSIESNVGIARELGYLTMPDHIRIDAGALPHMPDSEVCILTTGSQGEPRSALSRMASGDHRQVTLTNRDTVILSSKFIPGNERAIGHLINNLYRLGVQVYHEKVSEIHVSGHPSREECRMMMEATRARHFVPIHGELRHLHAHAGLAHECGIPPERICIIENGQSVEVGAHGIRRGDDFATGAIFIDGKGVGDIGEIVLRDRRHLSENGVVLALVAIDDHTGDIMAGPDVITRGVIFEEESPDLLAECRTRVRDAIEAAPLDVRAEVEEIKTEVRRTLRRYFDKTLSRRPLIVPVILELSPAHERPVRAELDQFLAAADDSTG